MEKQLIKTLRQIRQKGEKEKGIEYSYEEEKGKRTCVSDKLGAADEGLMKRYSNCCCSRCVKIAPCRAEEDVQLRVNESVGVVETVVDLSSSAF